MTRDKDFLKKLVFDFKLFLSEEEIEEYIVEQESILKQLSVLNEFDTANAQFDNMFITWKGLISSGQKGDLNAEALKTVPFSQDPYIVIPKIL